MKKGNMEKQSIGRDLARFIYNLSFSELPNEVVDRAKNLILDALSTAIAGRDQPYPQIGLGLIKDNKGNATIFTYDLRVPAVDAAFVNAIMVNSIGQDDMLYLFHAGQVVLPTAIAIAEQESSSGAEVITALVAGYDIMARIYLGAPSIIPRFRGVPVFGPFGAAAVTGKLLKLNEDQLTNAIGYAANFSSGLCECWEAGTMEAKFHCGVASRNGIIAATLAKGGATAAENSLEGKSGFYQAFAGTTGGLDAATSNLGKRFFIMDTTYKPYPVCGSNQVPVALAESLVKQHNIKGKDIGEIAEIVPDWVASYPGLNYAGPFTTRFQATMSVQFCAAATFLGKPVALISFYDNNYNDPEVAELAKKVKVIGEKRDTTRIEVTLQNGRQYSIEGAAGELLPSEILVPTTDRIKVKFGSLTSDFLGKEKADKIIDIVLNLDKIDNIGEFTQELE